MSDAEQHAEAADSPIRDRTTRRPAGRSAVNSAALADGFEGAVAAAFGVADAIGTETATGGLRLALRAAGVETGDDVFVPAFAPHSTVAAVLDAGATPVVVDVNPVTYTIGSFSLESAVERWPDASAVVAVHAAGCPAEMHRVRAIARANGLVVVEDARAAPGASYQGRPVGTFGDIGCFDAGFGTEPTAVADRADGAANAQAGSRHEPARRGGGVLVTDDTGVARRGRLLRDAADATGGEVLPGARRLDSARAAAGLDALTLVEECQAERDRLATAYARRLSAVAAVRCPQPRRDARHAFTQYVVDVPDRRALLASLHDLGVAARPVTMIENRVRVAGPLPVAQRLGDRLLALPVAEIGTEPVRRACRVIETHYRRRDRRTDAADTG